MENHKGEQMSEQPKDRNLSRHQFPTLRYIRDHRVTLQELRKFHGTTLSSLAYLGYIAKAGTGDIAEIVVTSSGENALRLYTEGAYNQRLHEGDLTERTRTLLRHVRKFRVLERKAS